MEKKILIVTTLREFKDDVHNQTQIEFLNSIKSQTYQNYELIITEFYEEELYSQLVKLKIKFKLVKSKLLSELSELDAKYSHWEFIDNVYPFLKKDQNIVISTLSDSIFEKNFFQSIVKYYTPNFSGTSWPQINYKDLEDYKNNKKYDIVNERITESELNTPLYKLMSDVYFCDGNIFLDEKFKIAWKNCKIHGVSHGFVPTIWFCFLNKNRINIYLESKIHNIINYSSLNSKELSGNIVNKKLWKKNDNLFKDFCKNLDVSKRYWKTNESFRKLFIFSSFSIKGNFLNVIFFKMIILKNFIYKLFTSLANKSRKLI